MKKYLGEILLITTAIIWGSGFVFTAISLDYQTPYQILAWRFFIGFVLLSLFFIGRLKHIKGSTIKKGAVLGTILYLAFLLQTVGLQYTTPSKNAFITATNVVIVPFIALFMYKRKIDKFELLGAFLAIIGIGFLSLQFTTSINVGDALTFGCAIAFAFQIFYTMKFVQNEDPILLTIVQLGAAATLGWIVVLFKGETNFSMEMEGFLSILYLAIFSTAVCYVFQTIAQKFTNETKTAIILSTEAFWGMVFSIIILHEVLTMRMIVGAVLILSAIIISETKLSFLKKGEMLSVDKLN